MKFTFHRRDFIAKPILDTHNSPTNPTDLFAEWINQAAQTEINPNACTLSTQVNNQPTARIVLLNEITPNPLFRFYTNYQSRKLSSFPVQKMCSLLFFWRSTEKQIIIEGTMHKTPAHLSDAYFENRPTESQISAIVSPQSQPIESTAEIKKNAQNISKHKPIMRPDFWGGIDVEPHRIEFWQGQPARLHNRLLYQKDNTTNNWSKQILAP